MKRGRGKRASRGGTAKTRSTLQQAAPKNVPASPIEQPTEEQRRRVVYNRRDVRSEMGHPLGVAYHREPVFETMAKRPGAITADELSALRFYRAAFDRQERSPTKSCLDFNANGGGGSRDPASSVMNATPSIVEARRKVRLCEAALGKALSVMRAVALHDMSFSEIAIERYGHRPQNWIDVNVPVLIDGRQPIVDGKPLMKAEHREKIVPRSGRHRELVRQEFIAGLRLLVDRVRDLSSVQGIEEIWIEPRKDCAIVHRGVCAPNGLYRLWGGSGQVDHVLAELRTLHGESLTFKTAEDARAVLEIAAGFDKLRANLHRLEPEELQP